MLQDIKNITEELIVNIQMKFFSALGVWCTEHWTIGKLKKFETRVLQ